MAKEFVEPMYILKLNLVFASYYNISAGYLQYFSHMGNDNILDILLINE